MLLSVWDFVSENVLQGVHQKHVVLGCEDLVVHLFEVEIAGGLSKKWEETMNESIRNICVLRESHKYCVIRLCVDMGEDLFVCRVHVLLHDQLSWRVYLWIGFTVESELVLPVGAPNEDVPIVGQNQRVVIPTSGVNHELL